MRPTLLLALPLLLALQACSDTGGRPVDGALAFKKCASCHAVGPNASGAFGPQLNGLFGRRAGSTTDYAYSDAMKRSGIVWDDATLAAFLRAPHDVVPGTRMRFWGIGDEREIAALLAHLRTYQDVR
ncbi:cytochrome c family protein [uncultured Massilia sp.]|uniref:c-type cytochrome n=1 Tax=uncultured Massilia sp. TaxID=169973 RepID=UPI0025DA33D8|nr:c-type cytochrome [uncultured Massilia sp.]